MSTATDECCGGGGVSATSVRVSWDRIALPEITGYTVYYSQTGNRQRQQQSGEESVTVPSSASSVVIGGLESNVQYQFQVAAIVLKGGIVRFSERSNMTTASTACNSSMQMHTFSPSWTYSWRCGDVPCCSPRHYCSGLSVGSVAVLQVLLAIASLVCT